MSKRKVLCNAVIVGAGLLLSGLAFADNCTGYDILVTVSADTKDVGNGTTLTVLRQSSVLITEDAPIYHLVSGECSGSLLATPDGKIQGSGHCVRRDKDGDTQSIAWTQSPGAQQSMWKLTGGSGKFTGKIGAGWAEGVRSDGNIYVVQWGGTCR